MSVCSNCGIAQGPFNKELLGVPICKNTKKETDRITKCVERRERVDLEKYKLALNGA